MKKEKKKKAECLPWKGNSSDRASLRKVLVCVRAGAQGNTWRRIRVGIKQSNKSRGPLLGHLIGESIRDL